jgi:hypothetical protein
MKKRIFKAMWLSVMAVAVVTVSSCSSDSDFFGQDGMEENTLLMPDEFKEIGVKHNEGLEASFLSLRQYYQIKTRSVDNHIPLSQKQYIDIMNKGFMQFCYDEGFDTITIVSLINNKNNIATKGVHTDNSQASMYINRIKKILSKDIKSEEYLLAKLNVLNIEAKENLSENDAMAVYAGTSTCYYSYLYWKENYMKWKIALNKPELLLQYDDKTLNAFTIRDNNFVYPIKTKSWWESAWAPIGETWDNIRGAVSKWWNEEGGKEVVGTDAGDAVAGALAGAMVGGSFTAGAGTSVGAIMGGVSAGCAGSISEAVNLWITK